MLELLFDGFAELVYITDLETYELLYINKAGREHFSIGELCGQKCYEVLQGLDKPCDFCKNSYLKSSSFYSWESLNPVTHRHYLLKDQIVDWHGRNAHLEIAFDITELEEQKAALYHLRCFDSLCGVWNRNRFLIDVEELAVRGGKPLGIVSLNINGMKAINEQLGIKQGDQILLLLLKKAQNAFPQEQLYRMCGDEFYILSSQSEDEFCTSVRNLQNSLSLDPEISAAVGYAWEEQCTDATHLIAEASAMMYENKRLFYRSPSVSNRYRHYHDKLLELINPGILEAQLAQGRFLIYLQPQVCCENRTLSGAEALIRYIDADGDVVPPDSFIPLLEDRGRIAPLDFFVFEKICEQLLLWASNGKPKLRIAVNFSRITILESHFLDKLVAIWEKYRTPKELLEIEITESGKCKNRSHLVEVMKSIQDIGFSIAIDDLGSEYASLAVLTEITPNALKADKCLVNTLAENRNAYIMLQVMILFCKKLKIAMVAEGVETEEQFEILKNLNCDCVQGYFFSKPITICEFEERFYSDGDNLN